MDARPLSSLKVLDFSTLLPGPYATLMLADMGAEVLRVESPTRPDIVRSLPPLVDEGSAAHHYLNRNKQSIALDLKQAAAIDIIKQLIMDYDIVVEQFRPGVMARLGLDYDSLKAINPALIYCSISGYGQTGPYRSRAGHDINYLAIAGVASYTGRADAGPLPLGIQLADIAGGSHHSIMGILAADIQRRENGIGQYIDISMTDAAFAINGMAGAGALTSGNDSLREKDWLNGASFYDFYRTRDNQFMSVGGLEPPFVKGLAAALEQPELLALTQLHNRETQQRLKPLLTQLFAAQDFSYWCALFAELDCCVEPALSLTEAAQHPQIQAREMVLHYKTGDHQLSQAACPIKFSASQQQQPTPAPLTGQHTQTVLTSLDYDPQQIQQLQQQGVI